MEERVKQFIQNNQLIERGDDLYLAVSGGVDSMAMLHFFHAMQTEWDLSLTVLTVDHQLRGEESACDVAFVHEQAEALDIPCRVLRVETEDYQRKHQVGVQEAARVLRYEAFRHEVSSNGKLVLAHHGDDQVETMFMRLTKGVVPTGMDSDRHIGSMQIIRPFLSVTKQMIVQYAEACALVYREDPSNESDRYTRNRFRHQLLPFVQAENPSIHNSAMNLHQELREDQQLLDTWAERQMAEIGQFCEQRVTFSINSFNALPQPLQRRGFHLILNYLSVYNQSYRNDFEAFKTWLNSHHANSQWTPRQGFTAIKSYDTCTITCESLPQGDYTFELDVGSWVSLPNGWILSAEAVQSNQLFNYEGDRSVILGPAADLPQPLVVRTRQRGDRIRPQGLNGHKKVKDIFIDHKVPTVERDTWPVVTDKHGRLLWIPFLCRSDWADVTHTNLIKLSIDVNKY
ncbi:tRNA(Ile)-lysidine synthase [Alkalibacillus flavidus]|uniref:tRNA(Ile)-lysidine synthase n=1 Tax=Alkalibacillus flavidus TaxID=546021 RepID=A0ABV2KW06_9BACI